MLTFQAMLLPVRRQIEWKALVERSARGFRAAARVSLQVARWALPPNPLEHLAAMLLPVRRQIE